MYFRRFLFPSPHITPALEMELQNKEQSALGCTVHQFLTTEHVFLFPWIKLSARFTELIPNAHGQPTFKVGHSSPPLIRDPPSPEPGHSSQPEAGQCCRLSSACRLIPAVAVDVSNASPVTWLNSVLSHALKQKRLQFQVKFLPCAMQSC